MLKISKFLNSLHYKIFDKFHAQRLAFPYSLYNCNLDDLDLEMEICNFERDLVRH